MWHTSIWVDFDQFSKFETLFDILSLDTLYTQWCERTSHIGIVVDDQRAHTLLATLLSHQIVWMWSIWWIFGDTRHDNNRLSIIVAHLNCGKWFVFGGRIDTRNRASRSTFTFITESNGTLCRLFHDSNERFQLAANHWTTVCIHNYVLNCNRNWVQFQSIKYILWKILARFQLKIKNCRRENPNSLNMQL